MKIVAQLIVGPGEASRYLKLVLHSLKSRNLCDDLVLCLNNTDEDTELLARKFTPHIYYDNREWGKFQPYIKEDFVKNHVSKFNPDWVISLDADEIFEDRVTRQVLENLASQPNDVAYFFWCIEFWDDTSHYREDYCFEDTRFYKFIPSQLNYRKQQVHCGMIPEKLHQWATRSNYLFYHYGLMKKEDRVRKVERYKKYDPKNIYLPKAWYDGLLHREVATKFDHDDFVKRIHPTLFRKKPMPELNVPIQSRSRGKVWRWINPHGNLIIFDQERHHLSRAKDRNPGWRFLGEGSSLPTERVEQPLVEELLSTMPVLDWECNVCSREFKTEHGLKIHKAKHV